MIYDAAEFIYFKVTPEELDKVLASAISTLIMMPDRTDLEDRALRVAIATQDALNKGMK